METTVKSTPDRYMDNLIIVCQLTKDIIIYVQESGVKTQLQPFYMDKAIEYIKQYKSEDVINGFITRSHLHWEKIHNRDESFLINNAGELFGEVPKFIIDMFSELFRMKNAEGEFIVKAESRNSLWELLAAMVRGSIRHIHEKRVVGDIVKDGVTKRGYTVIFFNQIKIGPLIKEWNVTM